MENKEVKTNVTNEELMQKVVGLEKEPIQILHLLLQH